jgi:hypothetical protein
MKKKNERKPKRRYRPPGVRKVLIRFEEIALAACKMGGGGGGGYASCLTGCAIDGS